MTEPRSAHRRHDRAHFFKYTDADTASKILSGGKLRWSSPTLLNDPFDVPRNANLGFTGEQLQDAVIDEIRRLIENGDTSKDPTIDLLIRLARKMPPVFRENELNRIRSLYGPLAAHAVADFCVAWEETVPKLRILCVSEINDSPPMWAHYARGHGGVVLQLDASDHLDSALLLPRPMIYQSTAPSLPGIETWVRSLTQRERIDWQEFFREYHYVKSLEWSYEKEWRVISYASPDERDKHTDIPFHPDELSAVYLGADVDGDKMTALCDILERSFPRTTICRGRIDQAARRILFDRLA